MYLQGNHGCHDTELLHRLKTGDKTAFSRLYELYSQPLYLNLCKLVKSEQAAEEILQELFVLIWEKRETISIQHSVKAYLFRMAENKVHDFFRKLKRDRKLYAYIKEISSGECRMEENLSQHTETAILEKALDVLPPQRRKVFYLCKVEGRSYNEVSQLLGISTSTINDHIVKATRSIREFILAHPEMTAICLVILFKLS